jgi:hypothetical protein
LSVDGISLLPNPCWMLYVGRKGSILYTYRLAQPRAAKPVMESKQQLPPGPADLQLKDRSLRLGGKHMFMFDLLLCALMKPQKKTLDSLRTFSSYVTPPIVLI